MNTKAETMLKIPWNEQEGCRSLHKTKKIEIIG
jgi:hypothetical protein